MTIKKIFPCIILLSLMITGCTSKNYTTLKTSKENIYKCVECNFSFEYTSDFIPYDHNSLPKDYLEFMENEIEVIDRGKIILAKKNQQNVLFIKYISTSTSFEEFTNLYRTRNKEAEKIAEKRYGNSERYNFQEKKVFVGKDNIPGIQFNINVLANDGKKYQHTHTYFEFNNCIITATSINTENNNEINSYNKILKSFF